MGRVVDMLIGAKHEMHTVLDALNHMYKLKLSDLRRGTDIVFWIESFIFKLLWIVTPIPNNK